MKNVIAKLDSLHQRLLDAVTPLDPQKFARRPSETEWSVAEVVHHLNLVEQSVLQELERRLTGPPQKAGLRQRFMPLRFLVGSRFFRVKAPERVVPLDPPAKEAVIENYNRTRAALKEFGLRHGAARLRQLGIKHPFLGNFDGVRAISFVGYHELRHYKQIQEIIKKISDL